MDPAVLSQLRYQKSRGTQLGAICTGAYILAAARGGGDRRITIHFDNIASLSEAVPDMDVFGGIFEIDSGLYTCSGGTSAIASGFQSHAHFTKCYRENMGSHPVLNVCRRFSVSIPQYQFHHSR